MKKIILIVMTTINIISCSLEHREFDHANNSALNSSKDLTVGCQIHFLGSPFNCPKTEFDLVSPPRSQSTIQLFNRVAGETRIAYSFQCRFNGPPPKALFSDETSNVSFAVAPTNDLSLQSGMTTSYTKTTYTPEGKIVHIKDKIDGSEIIPE